MLDQIEYRIATRLADHHNYPYARDIYTNIFRSFSHFPVKLVDVGIAGEGETITLMALTVLTCFDTMEKTFSELYAVVLQNLKERAALFFPGNIAVETFLGCIIYYYHPADIKNILATMEVSEFFSKEEFYEFKFKKKTILLFIV
jgi:hypothetical protein